MIGKEISLVLHYSVCGDGTFEGFCIEDNLQKIAESTAIRGCNQEVLYDSNHSSGVAVVKMTKDNIFHTIFDKEIMKGLTTQKSIKALKIRVIVKKIFVRNKMHS